MMNNVQPNSQWGDIELGEINRPQPVDNNAALGAQVGGTPQSRFGANISFIARTLMGGGAENNASAVVAYTGQANLTDRATISSTIVRKVLAKKSLIAGGVALFAAGAGMGGAIGARIGQHRGEAAQRKGVPTQPTGDSIQPSLPVKPFCPVPAGGVHLMASYVGPYDVNLLERAGFPVTKQSLIRADKVFDQFADQDGQLQHDVYSANIWNTKNTTINKEFFVDFDDKQSLSKQEFLGEILRFNLRVDTRMIGKQELLLRMGALWDNADIPLDAMVDAALWDTMVSQSDWGPFSTVQRSAAVLNAEKFWGSLPETIDQATWDSKGFEKAGYGSTPLPRYIFMRNAYDGGPFPELVSREQVEYFAVNDSRPSKLERDIGISRTGFNLIDINSDGELFDRPFEAYSLSDGEADFLTPEELSNAINEHFAPISTPSRALN